MWDLVSFKKSQNTLDKIKIHMAKIMIHAIINPFVHLIIFYSINFINDNIIFLIGYTIPFLSLGLHFLLE